MSLCVDTDDARASLIGAILVIVGVVLTDRGVQRRLGKPALPSVPSFTVWLAQQDKYSLGGGALFTGGWATLIAAAASDADDPGVAAFRALSGIGVWGSALLGQHLMVTSKMGTLQMSMDPRKKAAAATAFAVAWILFATSLGLEKSATTKKVEMNGDRLAFSLGGATAIITSMALLMKQRSKGVVYGMGLPLFVGGWAAIVLAASIET